jgi:tRNA (uracil-5-)-methyltransferase TRM9
MNATGNRGQAPVAGPPQADQPTSPARLTAGTASAVLPQRASAADSYDHYYGSGLYDTRYPRPNPPTYRATLRLAAGAGRILDFGAGSGRYTLPLLHATPALICAYDISTDACAALQHQATAAGASGQRLLVTADLAAARAAGPYDLVIALFGVLSHIEGTTQRIGTLRTLRSMLTRHGVLLLTVPNARRRFPLHASTQQHSGHHRDRASAWAPARRYFPTARQVTYHHRVDQADRPFPYYLYSRRQLATELSAAGFTLQDLEPDSILPERRLVRSPALAAADDVLRRLLPAGAGYGLRATCRPDAHR